MEEKAVDVDRREKMKENRGGKKREKENEMEIKREIERMD